LAQLVEQATLNRQVTGSSPVWPTKYSPQKKRQDSMLWSLAVSVDIL
jgi:hypothetical protein